MRSAFRKISRVPSLTGATKWYLSEDCLLSAKRVLYTIEYRRFYLRDLESVIVWPSRWWLVRLIVPGLLLGAFGVSLWQWANSTAGEIFTGIAVAWVALELALGPTAKARIRTTGASVDLPLVNRMRRAAKVLGRIDAAVLAARSVIEQPAAPTMITQPAESSAAKEAPAAAVSSIPSTTGTNAS